MNEFNEILVRRRPKKGMLQSMIEVPNDQWVKQKKKLVRNNFIKPFIGETMIIDIPFKEYIKLKKTRDDALKSELMQNLSCFYNLSPLFL